MVYVIPCSRAVLLGQRIAEEKGWDIAKFESRTFPDGEIYFKIDSKLKGEEVYIVQTGCPEPNDAFMEMMLGAEAASNLGAVKGVGILPYVPYARQDKRFKEGEALSLNAISKMMQALGCEKLVTVDAHYMKEYGEYDLYGLPAVNVSAGTLLVNFVKEKFGLEDLFIVSPDFGASEMIEKAAKESGCESGRLEKDRKSDYEVEVSGELDVKGKNVLVLDDIISTGGTMLKAIKKLREEGAEKVFVAATHGVFAGDSMAKLGKEADYVVTTDSIENETSEVSLAPEIAKVI